jgi:two-component system chemotaxis sensor kinase CheA
MQKDRLAQRLMVTFLGELEDHVRSLERNLLALEKQSTPLAHQELFATLFRSAHSLKGAARSVGVTSLEGAGHRLEELFVAGRDRRIPIDATYFNRVLLIIDEIREAGRSLHVTAANSDAGVVAQPGEQAPLMVPAISMAPTAAANAMEPPGSTPWSGMVRVSAANLDTLLAQSGELLVMRHRARERVEVARGLLGATSNWAKEWYRIEYQWADLLGNAAGSLSSDEIEESPRRRVGRLSGWYKAGLSRFARDLERLVADLNGDQRLLEQTAERIDAEVHRVRLIPFGEVCEGFGRMVRDLAAAGGKRAEVTIEGGDIAVDRSVLEGLKDPLIHLIRNAVDHGIEVVSARRASGKLETGRIAVSAEVRKARFEITVSDDGQGLDLAAIRQQLRKQGLPAPESDEELVEHIFLTGFSTAPR